MVFLYFLDSLFLNFSSLYLFISIFVKFVVFSLDKGYFFLNYSGTKPIKPW